MFVARRGGDERLASVWLVDTLDQSLPFKRFQCAIYSDQAQRGMGRARFIIHFDGGEGMCTFSHDLNDGAARVGKAIALFIQLDKPWMFTHVLFLILKIVFIFN